MVLFCVYMKKRKKKTVILLEIVQIVHTECRAGFFNFFFFMLSSLKIDKNSRQQFIVFMLVFKEDLRYSQTYLVKINLFLASDAILLGVQVMYGENREPDV